MARSSSSSPRSGNIKAFLFLLGFSIIAATLWYTHTIVTSLQKNQQETAKLYASSIEFLASERSAGGDVSFVFEKILQTINFPLILTDTKNEPLLPLATSTRNVALDSSLAEAEQIAYIKRLIADMDNVYPPIPVTYADTVILSYVHYGDSELVRKLRWLPYVEFAAAALFLLIGYLSFSYIKRSEQGSIWVGMARETAHQLGTPISSLLGWVEYLKSTAEKNPDLADPLRDMETDIRRLEKIADRFSKIGSKPDLTHSDLCEIVRRTFSYFERRLPQLGKRVTLALEAPEQVSVPLNVELFEWVLENLVKNALDAIETEEGIIRVTVTEDPRSVTVDVVDNGKGVDLSLKKDIFRPGFSTKKRGWGLGLSLSKRIVETYHGGKLTLLASEPGRGSTFRIRLKRTSV